MEKNPSLILFLLIFWIIFLLNINTKERESTIGSYSVTIVVRRSPRSSPSSHCQCHGSCFPPVKLICANMIVSIITFLGISFPGSTSCEFDFYNFFFMVKIAVVGCMHGELENLYETLLYLERLHNIKFDLVVCCGDFEVLTDSTFDWLCRKLICLPRKFSYTVYLSSSWKLAVVVTIFFVGEEHLKK